MLWKLIFLFCSFCCTADAASFRMYRNGQTDCEYRGYIPGGKVTDIARIKAPEAVLRQNAMEDVLGKSEAAVALASQSAAAAKAFLGVMKVTAGAMGPVMGVFAVSMGIFNTITEIKPKDIIDACNVAISKLTGDINDRLDKMKGYVDSKVIDLEKRLVKDKYEKYFNLWRDCVDVPNAKKQVECQERAYDGAASALSQFALYKDKLDNLTPYQSRELEAYLFVFRDYANLVLMMLKPLVLTFRDDKSKTGVKQFKLYSRKIKDMTAFFIKYARRAVNAIVNAHKKSPCLDTVSSSYHKKIMEGDVSWWKVNTANYEIMKCTIDEGVQQFCKVKMTIRVDGKNSYSEESFSACGSKNWRCATRELAKKIMKDKVKIYTEKDSKVVAAFWKKEILDFVPVWEKAYKVPYL